MARLVADPLATRALFALYRNHPSTPPADRWGWRAKGNARRQRDMLLRWAATQPDDVLLSCRNLGATSLAWIRANAPIEDEHDDLAMTLGAASDEIARLRASLRLVLMHHHADEAAITACSESCRAAVVALKGERTD